MNKRSELHVLRKSAMGAAAIMLTTAAIFGTMVQTVKASELSNSETVKTEYAAKPTAAADDSFQIDYTVLTEAGSPQADANAVTAEEAAKTGVQDLKRLFGMDSKGRTINMYYCPIGETSVRAEWLGNVSGSGNIEYYFSVDAVTGNISSTCRNIKLNKEVKLGFDKSLLENPGEYRSLTIQAINDYKILPEEVVSVEYASQGYAIDNPDIQLRAVDAKGNEAQLSFSRYDQKLLQVCYDNWVKAVKLLEEKFDK